jgi:hypothetical protein
MQGMQTQKAEGKRKLTEGSSSSVPEVMPKYRIERA